MDQDFKYDVYFSYSHKDKLPVLKLADRLRKDGLRVWIDEWGLRVGDDWARETRNALEQSRALILAISVNSLTSDGATKEWETAFLLQRSDRRRIIIPLRMDSAEMPPRMASLVYVDWRFQTDDQYK